MKDHREIILFAVVGMSPAVLTETVWALAHEKESVIPDRVVVLTTSEARKKIVEQLFSENGTGCCGWDRLVDSLSSKGLSIEGKLKFGLTGDSIRLFTDIKGKCELKDISSSSDNEAAADFILNHLRGFTSNPSTTVIASIAGGRKTMSALMISCMSLLGREQDRVCHVLVNPPFDTPMEPPFLFPEKGVKHKSRAEKQFSSLKAGIELMDLPFVRMQGWYVDKFKTQPPSYSALVAGVQKQVPKVYPLITLDMKKGVVLVDGERDLKTSVMEFVVLYLLCSNVYNFVDIVEKLEHFQDDLSSSLDVPWFDDFQENDRLIKAKSEEAKKQVVSRVISGLRKKTAQVLHVDANNDLIPRRGEQSRYPKSKINFTGKNPLDI